MSSSGRYNSRFFSFLSQQSRQVQDRSSILWRQAKLMAVWGVQILLYPIYLAFQSTRLATKQLQQTVRQTLPRLQAAMQRTTQASEEQQPLTSDTPILKVLAEVQAMGISLPAEQIQLQPALATEDRQSIQAAPKFKSGKPVSLRVRGIACSLESRKLVLATVQNHLLDGFTEAQQQQLQKRMVLELAEYWRSQKMLSLSPSPLVDRFLPLPHYPNAILPIRLFYQLMAWEQRGTIALATNLFQETRLRGRWVASPLEPTTQHQLFLSGIPERSAEVNWLPLEEWTNAVSRAISATFQGSAAFQKPAQESGSSAGKAAAYPGFQWLKSGTQALLDQINRLDHPDWEATDTSAIERYTKGRLATWSRTPTAVEPFQPKPKSIAVNAPVSPAVIPFIPMETALATVTPVPDQITVPPTESNQAIEVTSYIEADVQLVGYIKHPLEQVLEWLDRGMVWVESRLAKFWSWIQRR